MSYGMKSEEKREVIQFPQEGIKAVDVPIAKMVFAPEDQLFTAKSNSIDYDAKLNRELGGNFKAIRSMVIYSEVPIEIKGLYEDPIYLSAGRHPLQELPETTEFTVNYAYRVSKGDLEPDKIQTYIKAFNSPRLPAIKDDEYEPISKEKEKQVGSNYETVLGVPTQAYTSSRIKVHNEGSTNTADIKINTVASGNEFPEEIDTDSTPTTKELGPGNYGTINIKAPAQFVELEAKGDTTVRAEFVGEA